jgi:hypothetical protein
VDSPRGQFWSTIYTVLHYDAGELLSRISGVILKQNMLLQDHSKEMLLLVCLKQITMTRRGVCDTHCHASTSVSIGMIYTDVRITSVAPTGWCADAVLVTQVPPQLAPWFLVGFPDFVADYRQHGGEPLAGITSCIIGCNACVRGVSSGQFLSTGFLNPNENGSMKNMAGPRITCDICLRQIWC